MASGPQLLSFRFRVYFLFLILYSRDYPQEKEREKEKPGSVKSKRGEKENIGGWGGGGYRRNYIVGFFLQNL